MKRIVVILVPMFLYAAGIVFAQQDSLSCTLDRSEFDVGDGIVLFQGKLADGVVCDFFDI